MPISYNPRTPDRTDVWAFQGWSGMGEGIAKAGPVIGQALAERRLEKQQEDSLRQMLSPGTPSEEIAGMPMSPTAPGTAGFNAEQQTIWGEETGAEVPESVKSAAASAKAYRDILANEFRVPKQALATMGLGKLKGEAERLILQRQARKDALQLYEQSQQMASAAVDMDYKRQLIQNAVEQQQARSAQEGRMGAFQSRMQALHTPTVAVPDQVGLMPGLAVPPTAFQTPAEATPAAMPGQIIQDLWTTGAWRDPEANQMANAMSKLYAPGKGPPKLKEFRTSTGELFLVNEETGSAHPLKQGESTDGTWRVETFPGTNTPTGFLRDPKGDYRPDPANKPQFDYSPYDKNGDGILQADEYAAAIQAWASFKMGIPFIGMPTGKGAPAAGPAATGKRLIWDREKGDWK